MAAPTSQKAADRPISFTLVDSTGAATTVPFVLRPEDLTHAEPSLLTATQTLGGAWIDNFGRGISTIQIAGHTGWNIGAGWEEEFFNLHDTIWLGWHQARADAVAAGKSPDLVKLIFADCLDSIVVTVAPGMFLLRRNKVRPLLMQYQIGMTVISDDIQDPTIDDLALLPGAPTDAGLLASSDSLQDSINRITATAAGLSGLMSLAIASPMAAFTAVATGAFESVLSTVAAGGILTTGASQLIGVASSLALAGRNAFWTLGAVGGFSDAGEFACFQIAAAFENALCVLINGFRPWPQFGDYSSLYGASSCSSTVGGSPLSAYGFSNPFDAVLDPTTQGPAVGVAAQAGFALLGAADPVLAPMSSAAVVGAVSAITAGVVTS